MAARPLVALALVAGCSSKVSAPSCEEAVARASKRVGGEVAHGVAMCTRDAWSADLRACVAGAATQDALIACMSRFPPTHAPPPPSRAVPTRDDADIARSLVRGYARDAFPLWQAHHAGTACPASIAELDELASGSRTDPWGHPLVLVCPQDLPSGVPIGILSLGPDGVRGTSDDVRSW